MVTLEANTKRCDMCCKSLTLENFSKNCSSSDGLQGRCKDCTRKYTKWRKENQHYSKDGVFQFGVSEVSYYFKKDILGWTLSDFEEAFKSSVPTKYCSKCNRSLPLDNFSLMSSSKDGHQPFCKDCCKEINAVQRERRNSEKKRLSNIVKSMIVLTEDKPIDKTASIDDILKFKEFLISTSISYSTFIKILGIVESSSFKEAVDIYNNFSSDTKYLADNLLK